MRLALGLLASCLVLVPLGCKKPPPPQQLESYEQTVAKLQAALTKASPAVQSNFYNGVQYSVRYGNYLKAMMAADQISNDPSLTPEQKKLVGDLIEQLKTKVQNEPQPPK